MIFVAVGTQKFQMNRLLIKVDELIQHAVIKENVYAQTGFSDYQPKAFPFSPFLNADKFDEEVKQCRILITHGGVSTIIKGLLNDKPVIVVPRLAEYNEHVDNHQLQIATAFSNNNLVLMCENIKDLGSLINNSVSHVFSKYESKRGLMVNFLDDYLEKIRYSGEF